MAISQIKASSIATDTQRIF